MQVVRSSAFLSQSLSLAKVHVKRALAKVAGFKSFVFAHLAIMCMCFAMYSMENGTIRAAWARVALARSVGIGSSSVSWQPACWP